MSLKKLDRTRTLLSSYMTHASTLRTGRFLKILEENVILQMFHFHYSYHLTDSQFQFLVINNQGRPFIRLHTKSSKSACLLKDIVFSFFVCLLMTPFFTLKRKHSLCKYTQKYLCFKHLKEK